MDAFVLMLAILGAPPEPPDLQDLDRFPCKWVAKRNLDFAWKVLENLKEKRVGDSANEMYWQEAIFETQETWAMWDLLVDAHHKDYSEEFRRHRLGLLRDRLGPLYYGGRMPIPAPVWFFTRLD